MNCVNQKPALLKQPKTTRNGARPYNARKRDLLNVLSVQSMSQFRLRRWPKTLSDDLIG